MAAVAPRRGVRDDRGQLGLGLSAQRVDLPQSRKILAEILAGVPDDEQAKMAGGNTARVYRFGAARLITITIDKTPSRRG